MNHTHSGKISLGSISRKITGNRFLRRTLQISAVILAGAVLASPAMADGYRTVTVYETHRKPLVIIYGAPSTSVHIVRDSHYKRRDSFFDNFFRSTSYRSSYDSHKRGHNSHERSHSRHDRGYDRHDRGYDNHDRHRASSHRSYNSSVRYSGSGQARGSWSSGRQRDVIYVDKRGKKTSTYRQVERNSVQIRDRRR